ncbi:two-component system sensor histidine kinase MtrB [Motilibacter rhizosphaerae]|uniref:Sensor histidine kinase MtrB n=1 Tax=Motilibacter rhizosphaerae TaxID=598652 RepID=A0A4V2F4Q5_9ACTN|nr:MtrAB system histidine kinase MtrB [Motilibacter rhizosphaerae]RZS90139.1 two-component system sensor histidine kinase MtrB [Motilibacter rhizosphaerae]
MRLPSALRSGRRPASPRPALRAPRPATLPRAPLPRHPARRVVAAWRRSLRLRVVSTTVALSLLFVSLLGTFLFVQVRDAILRARVTSAVAETLSGAAGSKVSAPAPDGTSAAKVNADAGKLVRSLASTGGEPGRREVLLLVTRRFAGGTEVLKDWQSGVNEQQVVPAELRDAVSEGRSGYAYAVGRDPKRQRSVPALVVGTGVQVDGLQYELYYVFFLTSERDTLDLVRNTFLLAGIALVVLVGLIAYVVARTVVTPVRLAARIAERLAAGKLEERMHVRGEDDLARLGASFNRMATNLQSQIRALEDLSRVQRRFVSDVSHELRTPLTTVRMAADVLHGFSDTFPPHVARSSELLQTQLDRFEALLADLLEISRFDAGAAQLELEPVDLEALVRRALEAAEPLAERRGSELVLQPPMQPCLAECDPRRIERVVRNLVVNAVEHGEGRPITVAIAGNDEAVAIGVRDRGIGFTPEDALRVFDRFWRADPSRARHTGGTGLGLSIALEDAHLHGGWLQAYGEPGHGAHFRLTLPRHAGAELHGSPIPLGPARRNAITDIGVAYQQTERAGGLL